MKRKDIAMKRIRVQFGLNRLMAIVAGFSLLVWSWTAWPLVTARRFLSLVHQRDYVKARDMLVNCSVSYRVVAISHVVGPEDLRDEF